MSNAPQHPTKEILLDVAQALMLEKGFSATSLEEICEKAGVTKGGFFHHFKNKNELGRAVTAHYWRSTRDMLRAAPFRTYTDPVKRVYGFIDFLIGMSGHAASRNCLLGNLSQELSNTNLRVRNACAESFAEYASDLKADLDEVVSVRGISALDTKSIANHIIAVIEGALILAKAQGDMEVRNESLRHLKQYLMSIFEAPQKRKRVGHRT